MLCGSGRVSVASCGMASPPHEHIPGHNILVHAGRNARLKSGAETPFFNPTPSAAEIFALPGMSRSSSLPFYRLVRDRAQRRGLHLVRVFREDPAWVAGFRWFPGF